MLMFHTIQNTLRSARKQDVFHNSSNNTGSIQVTDQLVWHSCYLAACILLPLRVLHTDLLTARVLYLLFILNNIPL